ncbi:MAG TPA: CRTAC1 family protein [bacterium]|nr:CRTAC1 family protein [bacterium]
MIHPLRYLLGLAGLLVGAAWIIPPASQSAPSSSPAGSVSFQDVTVKVGLTTKGQPIIGEQWGDIAVADYDNSGWDSVYIGHHGSCNFNVGQPCTLGGNEGSLTWPRGGQLFHNAHGTFTETTSLLPPVTDTTQHRHIALWCDVEHTGFEDLIIGTGFRTDTRDVTGVNDLWLHNDGKSFTDIASKLGTTDLMSKVSAMTCGNLVGTGPDVLLANLEPTPPFGSQPAQHLWVNSLPTTPLQEQAVARGLTGTTAYSADEKPYGLACADFRRIGLMDCLTTGNNYSLWFLNNRNGTFTPTTGVYGGVAASLGPYNHDAYFADFSGHGFLDAGVALTPATMRILCNNGTTILTECSRVPLPHGPNAEVRSMAVGDFDNSGAPSIFVTMSRGCLQNGNGCKGPDALLMNNGHGQFTDMATQAGLNRFVGTPFGAGGAAVIDYDMDGRLDLIVGYNDQGVPGPFILYRNVTQSGNSWIGFRLNGPVTIGSWVTITACNRRQVQQLTARTGWVHQSSRVIHFGLGTCSGSVAVETVWRTGQITHFTLTANKYYTMTPTGQPTALTTSGSTLSTSGSTPSGAQKGRGGAKPKRR